MSTSILVWKISWTEEPRGPYSMGLQRVGHDLVTKITTSLTNNIKNIIEREFYKIWFY